MKRILSWVIGGLLVAGLIHAAEIGDLDTTDASNTARFPEGMAPSAVNDAARALEGILARGLKDTVDGYVLTDNTSSAFTVSANRTLSSYYDGLLQGVEWHTTGNTGATINIDSVGAKSLVWPDGRGVWTSELISGARSLVQFDSAKDSFQIITPQKALVAGTDYLAASAGLDGTIQEGTHTVWIPATAMVTRTTSGAAYSTTEATNKIIIPTYDFDASQDEFAQFQIAMPKSWDEGTVTAEFVWTHNFTTTNFGVAWGLECVAIGNDDTLNTTFGTADITTDTGGTTFDQYTSAVSDAVTCGGTPAEGDLVVFQVYRDVDDAGDTLAVDAKLIGVRMLITIDAANDD